jgi:hypothetical protein
MGRPVAKNSENSDLYAAQWLGISLDRPPAAGT